MEAGFILMMILHIILIGVGVRYKDNLIVAKIMALWLFILVGFNQGGPDITNYRVMYKQFGINGSYHFPGLDSLYGNWWVMSADLHWSMLISTALMLDLRTDFSLPCKLIAEEHFLYDSIFTRI
ncbi:hypothetical protein, partial [Weissella confusa]|uniref:hypothetical protein n=1 Tax=Weissella confusa TaxID=1583 RepID=UPI00223BB88D